MVTPALYLIPDKGQVFPTQFQENTQNTFLCFVRVLKESTPETVLLRMGSEIIQFLGLNPCLGGVVLVEVTDWEMDSQGPEGLLGLQLRVVL